MRSRYKFLEESGVYFVTFSIVKKIPIFTNSSYFDLIINNFEFYRKKHDLRIYYYVIMDNHLHLVCSSNQDIIEVIKHLKSYLAHEIIALLKNDSRDWILYLLKFFKKDFKTKSIHQVWEEGSHPKQIINYEMLNQKADYIHNNPVKRGIVAESKDWFYSSARNIHGLSNPFEIDILDD